MMCHCGSYAINPGLHGRGTDDLHRCDVCYWRFRGKKEQPMNDQEMIELKAQLVNDEGYMASAYQDTKGFWTIGVGRLIDARLGGKLSDDEIDYLFENDVKNAEQTCQRLFPVYPSFTKNQRLALINMAFNLGFKRLKKFTKMIVCVNNGDWEGAKREAVASLWYTQVGLRAQRIVDKLTETIEIV